MRPRLYIQLHFMHSHSLHSHRMLVCSLTRRRRCMTANTRSARRRMPRRLLRITTDFIYFGSLLRYALFSWRLVTHDVSGGLFLALHASFIPQPAFIVLIFVVGNRQRIFFMNRGVRWPNDACDTVVSGKRICFAHLTFFLTYKNCWQPDTNRLLSTNALVP